MASQTKLTIYTPKGIFWNQNVAITTIKTTEGYIGLQKNKAPFLATLDIAELHINERTSPSYKACAIAGGLVMCNRDSITIITDAIEFKENINLARARRARELAEKQIQDNKSDQEINHAQIALKKAINRIEVKNS